MISLPPRLQKRLGRPEGRPAHDDVALEARREVAKGGDTHVVEPDLEDDGGLGQRRPPFPFLDDAGITRLGQRVGAIQHKLAEMAIRIYVVESMVWRVVGLIESQLKAAPQDKSDAARTELKAVEEYAAECSIIKVYASEMLDYVVDEGVQIHGGYGYHQDYLVERAYRDSRVNRFFEGTNEINRLLIPGMLLKRAALGQLGPAPGCSGGREREIHEDPWFRGQ